MKLDSSAHTVPNIGQVDERRWTMTDASHGKSMQGLLDELILVNRCIADVEFASIPAR